MNPSAEAHYFDGQSARPVATTVRVDEIGHFRSAEDVFVPILFRDVTVHSRIGDLPRRIELPGGAVVETFDHFAVDAWLATLPRGGANPIHRLERNLPLALAATAIVAAFAIASIVWGLPWLSHAIAARIPPEAVRTLGEESLDALDRVAFAESELEADRQQELRRRFQSLVPAEREGFDYRLFFRKGEWIGPNAFALPNGTVVVTDELVALLHDDQELEAVLLHEIGHVVGRHSLELLVSQTGVAALVATLLGDVGTAGALAVALPQLLLETRFSRAVETEADDYALAEMRSRGMDTNHFANVLERMEACAYGDPVACGLPPAEESEANPSEEAEPLSDEPDEPDDPEESEESEESQESGDPPDPADTPGWLDYLNSHPATPERIARFRTTENDD